LPDNIQKLLKMIRDVKKQIAEKQQQLQQVLTNSSLSPEQAKAQASALQGEISSLTASLITLNASLAKAMKDMSSDDALKAASLAAK
jgi:prefoldin subunit 5